MGSGEIVGEPDAVQYEFQLKKFLEIAIIQLHKGEVMNDKKIQWHPGFVAAMNLELKENKNDLIFEKEHNLNTKPLEVDLLIIKKEPSVHIVNEIGAFFRGYNIVEYKSPRDHLDIDVFYKSLAYACLYKSYGETLDERKADDITVSIIREACPRELFKYLREHGYALTNPSDGIYSVTGNTLFPIQVIVTQQLDEKAHAWLKALSENLKKEDIEYLLGSVRHLTEASEQEMADSVLEVTLKANKKMVQELMGDDSMYEALMEIMEPQLIIRDKTKMEEGWRLGRQEGWQEGRLEGRQEGRQEGRLEGRHEGRLEGRQEGRQEGRLEGRQEGRQEGLQKGIRGTVDALRKFGIQEMEIITALIENYGLSEEEAGKYL